jgi:uncharacterized protein YggE
MKPIRIAVLVAAVVGVSAFAGVGLPEGAKGVTAAGRQEITVTGTGTATTVPDRAVFTFGIQTRGKTASETLAANSRDMRKAIAAIKGVGVKDGDVQTSEVSLSPDYQGSDLVGYTAVNSVTVTVRGIDRSGPVIDAAVGAGADQVSGPSFMASDAGALYRSALKAAVTDARSRAEVLAAAAGVQLGPVTSIDESSATPVPYANAATTDSAPPIEPGSQNVDATVTVTYSIG